MLQTCMHCVKPNLAVMCLKLPNVAPFYIYIYGPRWCKGVEQGLILYSCLWSKLCDQVEVETNLHIHNLRRLELHLNCHEEVPDRYNFYICYYDALKMIKYLTTRIIVNPPPSFWFSYDLLVKHKNTHGSIALYLCHF